jgi:hypothetical protein
MGVTRATIEPVKEGDVAGMGMIRFGGKPN